MNPKLKPWLLVGVIFIVGVVTGSALTIGLGPRFMHGPDEHDMKRHWMAHLTRELDLNSDQQAKIQPILADAAQKLEALHHDERQQGVQIFKAADDQISALLSPDQQAKLQKMEAEREKMFSGHLHPPEGMFHQDGPDNPPPPPPQPPPNPAPAQ